KTWEKFTPPFSITVPSASTLVLPLPPSSRSHLSSQKRAWPSSTSSLLQILSCKASKAAFTASVSTSRTSDSVLILLTAARQLWSQYPVAEQVYNFAWPLLSPQISRDNEIKLIREILLHFCFTQCRFLPGRVGRG